MPDALRCDWCSTSFAARGKRGPKPKYCKPACRQRAFANRHKALRYSRSVLVDVLVYHWRTNTSGCGCGWAELGRSHPEHVAEVYEASIKMADEGQPSD